MGASCSGSSGPYRDPAPPKREPEIPRPPPWGLYLARAWLLMLGLGIPASLAGYGLYVAPAETTGVLAGLTITFITVAAATRVARGR